MQKQFPLVLDNNNNNPLTKKKKNHNQTRLEDVGEGKLW